MKKIIAPLILLVLTTIALPSWAEAPLRFGVLAYRPKDQIEVQLRPLATYLETALGQRVELSVLNSNELNDAVAHNLVDIVLTNPGEMILLRHLYSLSAPLATQIILENEHELSAFGGVIFTRSDIATINSLADIAGKRIATANTNSLGSYQMQAFELLEAGEKLPDKTKLLNTGLPQDLVVAEVLAGRADVGFVRSGLLESMVQEGKLELSRIKIIHKQNLPGFPYFSSTRLYPEWPVAVSPYVDDDLARRITIALLSLPANSTIAHNAGLHGFTTPADYSGVEEILRRLRMQPYDAAPNFTLADLWKKYTEWLIVLGMLVALITAMGMRLLLQTRRISLSESRMSTILENVSAHIYLKDTEGRYLFANRSLLNLWNTTEEEVLGFGDEKFLDEPTVAQIRENDRNVLVDGKTIQCEETISISETGKTATYWSVKLPLHRADGSIYAICGISTDISDRKRAEEKLQLAASVFTYAREGIIITDAIGTIIDVNDTFTHITGYRREEVLGKNPRMLESGRQEPEFYLAMWQELAENGHWTGEIWNQRKNGEQYAELLTISAVRDAEGITQNYVALFTDIMQLKQHQQQLEHIAHFDVLTGLPNRTLLADRLQQAMLQSQRRNKSLAVAFLDLDGFKAVNDKYGHKIGDELLIVLAQRMKEALRDGDTLARIGGDEFVAVLVDLDQTQDCEPLLERLLQAAADPATINSVVLRVSTSIGVTVYPQDSVDADQLMRHADQAMYMAKQTGKNRYHLFDVAHDDAMQTQRESLDHIRQALSKQEFVLYYQPKVNMQTGVVIGAEALIRWKHPKHGLLPPASFLPIIENHQISLDIGEWVINTALTQMSTWQAAGLNIPISVNIGAHQLQHDSFVTRLSELLASHPDVKPANLELEILETSALEDISQVTQVMRACHDLGVRFALDDFGTGYSSLTYLKRLPADILKIDQSFVRDMIDDPDDRAIVEGVVGLAKAFHREVIAEGVETIAHGILLLSLGCELAQGYGIARPMPAKDLPDWVVTWHPDPAWTTATIQQ